MTKARSKVGLVVATALSVTIIVGAGLLALPGLSFAVAGRLGWVPWMLVTVAMLPLLIIFAYFGRTHPSAGGVVGYVRASLGSRLATVCEVIVLGTFTLGIPAIAIIGAQYLQSALPGAGVTALACGIVTLAFTAGVVGLRVSGFIQTTIASLIVVGLVVVCIGFIGSLPDAPREFSETGSPAESFHAVLSAIPLILFAFTGWEMTAFLAEDMADPKRDIPRSIWISFVIVAALYLAIAWVVAINGQQNPAWKEAPVAEMARIWLGQSGGKWVAAVAAMLVLANVVAAFISVSRAIFSAGRDGVLPRVLSKVDRRGEPLFAMTLTYALFLSVIAAHAVDFMKVDTLLQLAGQNFFVLYFLVAIGYLKLQRGSLLRQSVGIAAIAVVASMMFLFSASGLLYCAVLSAFGLWIGRPQPNRP